MAANNDTMARFLFAILQQKNLKDIDWSLVARNPVLTSEITNGHAARMRFSRFKASVLNLEPTRRNRVGKPRVSKAKRDPKGKREDNVKSEPASDSPIPQESREMSVPIKQEPLSYAFENRLTPRLTPGPSSMPPTSISPNTSLTIHPRFLTPCSDADMFSPSPSMTPSPAGEMIASHNSFDYRGSPCPDHTDQMWQHAPPYTTFAAATATYPYEEYGAGSCEHPHMQNQSQVHLGLPTQTIESDGDYVDVKHEDWDPNY